MKFLARVAMAVALTVSLSGCVSWAQISNPATKDRVIVIKEGLAIAKIGAAAYRDSCDQRIIPPSCRLVVPEIVEANRKADILMARVDALRKLGPSVSLTQALDQASDAVNAFKVLIPSGGI